MLGSFMRVAAVATFLGSLLGALVDLRFSGQGLGTLLVAALAGYGGMRNSCAAATEGADAHMWAMMAGMAGGGFGGLVGAVAAATAVAVLGPIPLHAMDWSMLLMGGGMGGMLGATLGGAMPVRHRFRTRLGPRLVVWRLRRSA